MTPKERKRDIGWEHAVMVDNNRSKTKCKWCGHIMAGGGITRLKIHLAGTGGHATACAKCPMNVSLAMKALVRAVQKSQGKSKEKDAVLDIDHGVADVVYFRDDDTIGTHDRFELREAMCQSLEVAHEIEERTLRGPLSTINSTTSDIHGPHLRIAYQGAPGADSEAAACKAYPNCETVPYGQLKTAFDAVERWLADLAVLPIENSIGGSIHRNYDLLFDHKLHVVGDVQLGIHHCLLANHGVKIEDLKRVLSHPHALAQCASTLMKLGVAKEAVDDSAGAAQFIAAEKLQDAAAVGSPQAAEIYGLNILAHNIQDEFDNFTRFLLLSREPLIPGGYKPSKTSIIFSLEDGPGALFKAIAVFSMRQINITKIESRPAWKRTSVYDGSFNGFAKYDNLFYLDFEASIADPTAQNAMRNLKELTSLVRVLGSYPICR